MPRLVVTAALLSLGTMPATAKDLTVTFIAHAAVHITDGQAAVLVDFPYDPGTQFMPWSADAVPSRPKALCLITHGHRDHFVPEIARRFCDRVLGPRAAVAEAGVELVPLRPTVRWKGLTISAIASPHETEHYCYLLDWHGVRLYFTGDAESPEALLAARSIDAAFVRPGLLIAVKKVGGHIDARTVISYHHRPTDPVPNFQDRVIPQLGQQWTLRASSAK
ncbi:MAG TPA: MBL fold metallo-hydrolase [Thermoanaerobaculia bacterium]|jgi:L-ascorbate metabolism protein UlaG (beta-lactamase superfamily)|nr:MBL fold metallo-hydrolase [Thermoanaerobaculia bacterium]